MSYKKTTAVAEMSTTK